MTTTHQTAPSAEPGRKPRIFYGWYLVAASFFSNTLTAGLYWQGFQVFFLPLIQEFGWSRAALSGAFAMRQVETGIAAPVVGVAIDKWGPRRVIMMSAWMLALGLMLVGFTSNLITFYIFFFFASIGASGTSHSVSWAVLLARWFSRRRGTAIGIGTSGPALAGLILVILSWSVETFGWRISVQAGGAVALVVLLAFSLVVRDRPEDMGLLPDGEAQPSPNDSSKRSRPVPREEQFTVAGALRDYRFWVLTLLFTSLFFGTSGMHVHHVPYFQNDLGLSSTEAAAIVAVVFLVSGVGRIGVGVLTDILDLRIVLGIIVVLNISSWAYLLAAPLDSWLMVLPYAILFGIPFGAVVSIRPLLMAKLFGGRSLGSLLGLFHAGALGSGIVGPVIMGWIYDVQGSYHTSLFLFLAVSVVAAPLVFLIRPRMTPTESNNALS